MKNCKSVETWVAYAPGEPFDPDFLIKLIYLYGFDYDNAYIDSFTMQFSQLW